MSVGAALGAIVLLLGSRPAWGAAQSLTQSEPNAFEIESTGWGVAPPAGFVSAEGMPGAWKPSASGSRGLPLARNSLIRVYSAFSAEACRPQCAGEPVPPAKVSRSAIRGLPADGFQCREGVFYLGMAWPYSDFTILHLEENVCAVLALLARSKEGRRQALAAFAGMHRTMAPLPKASQPAAEGQGAEKALPLLR